MMKNIFIYMRDFFSQIEILLLNMLKLFKIPGILLFYFLILVFPDFLAKLVNFRLFQDSMFSDDAV